MRMRHLGLEAAIVAASLWASVGQAAATTVQLISNGSFSEGVDGFASWTVSEQPGSAGAWALQTGPFSNVTQLPVPLPPDEAAMVDPFGPYSGMLSQTFTIPSFGVPIAKATFSATVYLANYAEDFFTPASTDYRFDQVGPNQQFSIRLGRDSAQTPDVGLDETLLSIYQTKPGDNRIFSSYTPITIDVDPAMLDPYQGEEVGVAFRLTANMSFFVAGVTGVGIHGATDSGTFGACARLGRRRTPEVESALWHFARTRRPVVSGAGLKPRVGSCRPAVRCRVRGNRMEGSRFRFT